MNFMPIVKLSTTVVFAASAAVAAAQTMNTTTPGYTVVAPSNGTSVEMSTAVNPAYGRAPSPSLVDATIGNLQAACAGLSDRQTERACKQDRHHGIVDRNPSKVGNDAGNADDQAD
jgi:hypothetical protein